MIKQRMVRGAIVGVTCAVLFVFGLVGLYFSFGFLVVVEMDSSEYQPELLAHPEFPRVKNSPPAQGPPSPSAIAEVTARRYRDRQTGSIWGSLALLLYLIFLFTSTLIARDVYRARYSKILRWYLPMYFSLFAAFAFVFGSGFTYGQYLESFYNPWPAELHARAMERAWIGAWAYFKLQDLIATKMLTHGPYMIGSALYLPFGLLFGCYYVIARWVLKPTWGGPDVSPKSKTDTQYTPES